MPDQRRRRRTFGPVVLLGLAGAGLAAYAGHHNWITLHPGSTPIATTELGLDNSVTTAFGLVALAAWGVVLVTRGWVRRGVAILAGFAAIAPVPAMWGSTHHLQLTHPSSSIAAWPWVAAAACLVAWAAAVLAVIWAPSWPEMGRKYDAPTTAVIDVPAPDSDDNAAIWRSLSEGHDPTDGPSA